MESCRDDLLAGFLPQTLVESERRTVVSQSLVCQYTHMVFSTKGRRKMIPPRLTEQLHDRFASILQNIDSSLIQAGGIPDHRHILARIHQSHSTAEVVQKLKSISCGWIRRQPGTGKFRWQRGYAAFSVSPSQVPWVVEYIRNQREHHRRLPFKDELRRLSEVHGFQVDETFLWD